METMPCKWCGQIILVENDTDDVKVIICPCGLTGIEVEVQENRTVMPQQRCMSVNA